MSAEAMPRVQNLERRGSRYYLRMRVPADVAEAFGRSHVRKSLGSSDWREARHLLRQLQAEYERRFAELRAEAEPARPQRLTYEDVEQIVSSWRDRELQRVALNTMPSSIDGEITSGDTQSDMEDYARFLVQAHHGGSQEISREVEDQTHRLLIDSGFPEVVPDTVDRIQPQLPRQAFVNTHAPEFAVMKRKVQAGLEAIARAHLLRHRGQTPLEAALNPVDARDVSDRATSVTQLLQQFRSDIESQSYGAKKLLHYNVVGAIFDEVFGPEKLIDEITTLDCRGLIDVLRTIPPNAKKRFPDLTYSEAARMAVEQERNLRRTSTITSDIHAASAIFNWAVNNGMLEKNPMPKGTARRMSNIRADEQRDAFNGNELQTIFSSPVFTGVADARLNLKPTGTCKPNPARFWLPLLSLFHGFRLNEIAQLYVDDIDTSGTIPFIAIRALRPDQQLKNQWSQRTVPIHPVVLEIGFLDFVASRPREGRLFELNRDRRGYYSGAYQKWFSRYLKVIEVKKRKNSFHSFRHTFRNAARRARIPTGAVCRLGGWAMREVHERYGNHE
ncbi:MAG: site-specific integrase, partial [Pseudomonadota bacterium]